MLDVFNRRRLRNMLGMSWKDHVSNEELLERTKIDNLHEAVDKRRRRFVGHVLRLPSARPVSAAVQWTPEGGGKEEADPGRHDRTRYVMTYKRWMSAGRRPSQSLVTAMSGDHQWPNVPAGTG